VPNDGTLLGVGVGSPGPLDPEEGGGVPCTQYARLEGCSVAQSVGRTHGLACGIG
jgi:hypothetical protein